MLGSTTVTLLLLAPAAPVPAGARPPGVAADPAKLAEFGNLVYTAASQLSANRPDADETELATGAVRGLFEAAGERVPDDLLKSIRDAKRHEDRALLIGEARGRLAAAPPLRGVRAFLAAAHGFRHAFDPLSGLSTLRSGASVSVDMDFGLGFELDGVEGQRVTAYRLERLIAAGQVPPTGFLDPPPRPNTIASPASYPWRVRRVVPGSPAHRAGMRAGDIITHLNDDEVTPPAADRLFGKLTDPPDGGIDPKTGVLRSAKFDLELRRGGATKRVELATDEYTPTNVAGCVLRDDGTWDGMLDPVKKIGYLRVGAMELRTGEAATALMKDLDDRGCRGLVLDLRWCPGGYVDPGTAIAGMFLPEGSVIAKVALLPNVVEREIEYTAPKGARFPNLPLVVLVGPDTLGGGELIAAALQDHKRAAVVGQRTAGRAATQKQYDLKYGNLMFKATYGTTLRPSGKPRHRTPTSLPTDDWGVRPTPGLEVPLTPAVAAEVRGWAEEHGLRPAGSRAGLPFDDPDRDPVRAAALAHLRRQLAAAPAQD
jgi:hypothetical protein